MGVSGDDMGWPEPNSGRHGPSGPANEVAPLFGSTPVTVAASAVVQTHWTGSHSRKNVEGGVVPSGGELWTTDARATDGAVAQWQQILSDAYVPWTVAIPELPHRDAFRGWLRRWQIGDLALV
ncbi:MAG: hypothetical protein JWR37_1242, partial [Mycobacterium sp.]|nr:hypothetical protein [Mycobacterium sp.]